MSEMTIGKIEFGPARDSRIAVGEGTRQRVVAGGDFESGVISDRGVFDLDQVRAELEGNLSVALRRIAALLDAGQLGGKMSAFHPTAEGLHYAGASFRLSISGPVRPAPDAAKSEQADE